MTIHNTSSGKKEKAVENLRDVSAEVSEPKDKGISDREGGLDPQPTVKPGSDIDDGGLLSI